MRLPLFARRGGLSRAKNGRNTNLPITPVLEGARAYKGVSVE